MFNPICLRCANGDHATHKDGRCAVRFGSTGDQCACADRSADVTASQKALDHATATAIADAAATEPPPVADEPTMRDLLLVAAAIERAMGHTALALSVHVGADADLFNAIMDTRDAAIRASNVVNIRIDMMLARKGGR